MNEKSTFLENGTESCRRWDCNTDRKREWTHEGKRTHVKVLVAIDGNASVNSVSYACTKKVGLKKSKRVAPR